MRQMVEDFRVDEVPAYRPCGQGTHLFVRFEKSDLTTPVAVSMLAKVLQVAPKASSYAGLKDRRGVTRQWASFEAADPVRLRELDHPQLRVLEHDFHTNKLRTGHLKANRFQIRVRNPEGDRSLATALLEDLSQKGCPNYYGEQRFGAEQNNAEVALAFITGQQRPPRDRFKRRFLFSAFQSALFNQWLANRVERGELATAIAGDLMRKEDTGGLFTSEDLEDLQSRAADFLISATGPMFGAEMRWPQAIAEERERELLASAGIDDAMLLAQRKLGSGTRRVCRVRPEDWAAEVHGSDLELHFTLPKGAYATTVMRELMKGDLAD